MLSASKCPGFAAFVSSQSFLREFIKLAGASVLLDLLIPGIRVIPSEPISKCLEIGPIEFFDFTLQQLNFGRFVGLPCESLNDKGGF
jgi:hypothetical protein